MPIAFNNIPSTTRTPGVFTEIDNSRALQGLTVNPHKVLIIGQKTSAGSVDVETLQKITSTTVAHGYFGIDSILGRMCKTFKDANPNTDLYAIALSVTGGVKATGDIKFSIALSHAAGAVSTNNELVNLMVGGIAAPFVLTSGWSVADVNSAAIDAVNAKDDMPVLASTNATSALIFTAVQSGTLGNGIDIRLNYYDGQSNPTCFGDSATITDMAGGSVDPDITDAWAVVENTQFHYMVNPYGDATNLAAFHDELEERFGPMIDKQGLGVMAKEDSLSNLLSFGDGENSAFITTIGDYDSPTPKELWASNLSAVLAFHLNQDPARPLHTLALKGVLPPPLVSQFTQTERNLLLFDGISTWVQNANGDVAIERMITMYQTNTAGGEDVSYLNVNTLATLSEIRYQYNLRMMTRFIIPRFKLADDTYPIQPGQVIAQPKTIKSEIIALFAELRDAGYIENLDDFADNLIVERNSSDRDRVDVLLPPDLINQFRIMASVIQFIL